MGHVVKFEAHGKEYDLSVIDRDGEKWITSQQLGEALGNKQIRRLIQVLKKTEELQESKHYRSLTAQNSGPGNPARLVLSYRGVIRVAMRSQGSRARLFRDWAEDVLYEVMMTGSYGPALEKDRSETEYILSVARRDAMLQGITLGGILREFHEGNIAKAVHFRRMGLSQKETARALQLPLNQIKTLEHRLGGVGIHFDPVIANKRDKIFKDTFLDSLIPRPGLPMQASGGAL